MDSGALWVGQHNLHDIAIYISKGRNHGGRESHAGCRFTYIMQSQHKIAHTTLVVHMGVLWARQAEIRQG